MAIYFHTEDIRFRLKQQNKLKNWIQHCIEQNSKTCGEINYIFCSDEYLLKMNKSYLNHDYYTDIITFDNGEGGNEINTDLFISIDRVKANAENLGRSFDNELYRVMIHGILHLLGWNDKSEKQAQLMRETEDKYLNILELD